MMVVEHGSFSSAARIMGLSQPAVTMQVQALEADLGVTLLDRKYRRVEVTEAGRLLLPFAERMLRELDSARIAIDGLSGTVSGRLELAASTTPGQYILPKILGSFLAANDEVGVSLRVMDTTEVVEAVASGEANLGMTGADIAGSKVHFRELGTDNLMMICPPKHSLASEKSVDMEQIVEQAFIMREAGSGTRMVTEHVFRTAGVDPGDLRVVMELGTGEAIVSAVEGGLGIAVVSAWVAAKAIELGTVVPVPFAHFPVKRPLFLVTPRGSMTRAGEAFVAHLNEALGE
ncbi:MAG: LysR family transcriptional regulator [Actinobacteria bacterium]|nr:LysR family transcriptional regulator [Actinomycetota bacterium]